MYVIGGSTNGTNKCAILVELVNVLQQAGLLKCTILLHGIV